MATKLHGEQLFSRYCHYWASPCQQCHTDEAMCFYLTKWWGFRVFPPSECSYIIPTAQTIWNIPPLFQWNPRQRCRAIFGQMHHCAKCTLVFQECFFSPLQGSHFWTRVSWFIGCLGSLCCLQQHKTDITEAATLGPKLQPVQMKQGGSWLDTCADKPSLKKCSS